MTCPECGAETEMCSGYDAHDYTIWGDCCPECEWTNLGEQEGDT